jgi:sugar/nucleoside kinase (ribokinase family)
MLNLFLKNQTFWVFFFKVKTILNFAPATNKLQDELLSNTDYLILNEIETEQLSNYSIKTVDDAVKASISLLDKFNLKSGLIVTLGANGVLYTDKITKNYIHKKCPNVKVVDTTVSNSFFFELTKSNKKIH